MNNDILDDNIFSNTDIKNNADIKRVLKQAGIHHFFEHKNGSIIVQQSDAVQVSILFENNTPVVKAKFPQIGNSVQVIISGVFLALSLYFGIPFPLPWVIAVIGGQIASFAYYYPKTKELQKRIERNFQNKL